MNNKLNQHDIDKIAQWLKTKTAELDFAEIILTIRLSNNRPPMIIKTVSEKEVPSEGGQNYDEKYRT